MATEKIQKAFSNDSNLATRVTNAYIRCQADPELSQIFIDIATHLEQLSNRVSASQQGNGATEQVSKKRKLDNDEQTRPDLNDATPFFQCQDVSFTMPVRKKLKLELFTSPTNGKQGQIRLVDGKSGNTESTLNANDIEYAFCLPVPEKAQRQQNYVIIPKELGDNMEHMVFTMNEAPDKAGAVMTRSSEAAEGETLVNITSKELASFLSRQGMKLTLPNDKEFASSIPQSHRKGEKAYHVKAFRGSKEGYLFFLSNGIFFGFKKPLLFYPFGSIESISYTSVLQRTFNLVITPLSDAEAQDVEFSMLDQADFAGIDEYIKEHGLNDASMAADRRAKMYNVNKEAKEEELNGDAAEDDGQTELQRAEQALQDEEDELEEDYDPSGGESDGEGEESGEESGENDEGYEEGGEDAEADNDDQVD